MLHTNNLTTLARHLEYLHKIIDNHSLFVVGGAVRDILLGLVDDPLDIDLTMAGHPEDLYKKIKKQKNISHFMTEKYGTITMLSREDGNEYKYELTPFRTETQYDDHRHPEQVQRSDNILEDARRRDFTVNCLYYTSLNPRDLLHKALASKEQMPTHWDNIFTILEKEGIIYVASANLLIVQKESIISQFLPQGEIDHDALLAYTDFIKQAYVVNAKETKSKNLHIIIDPYQGLQDLAGKRLRAVGNPDDRFFEDALRLMRGLRFVNVVNQKLLQNQNEGKVETFDFESKTWLSIKKNYYLIQDIAKERIKEEVCKVFKEGNPFGFIALLDEVNMLKWIFPALYATKGVNQPVRYHPFDVYSHTLLTLKELQEINTDYLTRLGMLYHDVGKVDQYYSHSLPLDREEIRKTFGSWINHHISGVDHVQRDFARLGFSTKETETIARYVANHSKPGEILFAQPEKWEKKLRNMLSEGGYEKVANVIDITVADRRGQMNPLQNSYDVSDVYQLKQLLDELYTKEGQFTMSQLAIDGNDIMQALGIKPGPQVGELLQAAFRWAMDDIVERNTKEELLQYIQKHL